MTGRVRTHDNWCTVYVAPRGKPREMIVRITYADPITEAALTMEAERIFWVRRLVALLGLLREGDRET